MYPLSESAGFRSGHVGTHTSRTLMFTELEALFREVPERSKREDYLAAIVEHNALSKKTLSTRRITWQRLSELYSLDLSVPLFAALRYLWGKESSSGGRALLAVLCALARDPLLRATADIVLDLQSEEDFSKSLLEKRLAQQFSARFNQATIQKIGRNTASSWTQSGHLVGRVRKSRARVLATPATTAYALFLGHLEGFRAQSLFSTMWTRVLDSSVSQLRELALAARMTRLLDLKTLGHEVDINFSPLEEAANRLRRYGKI